MEQQVAQQLQERLYQVAAYYREGDTALGYRRMMDAALDTGNSLVFGQMTDYTDWLSQRERLAAEQWEKAAPLLDAIEKAGVTQAPATEALLLEASNIRKRYRNGAFALGPVTVMLRRGELLGLVGENGNGKTTLLRILARELAQDEGTVHYPVHQGGDDYDLRSRLAYIPQRTPKWQGSLRDNLKFTLASYGVLGPGNEALVLMIIARMGLWQYKDLDWRQLSSGYKMRFELARTFLRCPDILLLDEPLANLDVMAQQVILEDLKSLAASLSRPMGIVLSSQQLYEVEKVSDSVLFLKNGQPLLQDNRKGLAEAGAHAGKPAVLVVEFDTEATKEALQQILAILPLIKISFNGGSYIAEFEPGVTMPRVLSALGDGGIDVLYIRNISHSTRRFFIV